MLQRTTARSGTSEAQVRHCIVIGIATLCFDTHTHAAVSLLLLDFYSLKLFFFLKIRLCTYDACTALQPCKFYTQPLPSLPPLPEGNAKNDVNFPTDLFCLLLSFCFPEHQKSVRSAYRLPLSRFGVLGSNTTVKFSSRLCTSFLYAAAPTPLQAWLAT